MGYKRNSLISFTFPSFPRFLLHRDYFIKMTSVWPKNWPFQNDRETKPGSPKDDQEFMLEFLLGHKGVDMGGGSGTHSPTGAPIDSKRAFVDPDDYFSLKPLPNNSTLNSTQVGTPVSQWRQSFLVYWLSDMKLFPEKITWFLVGAFINKRARLLQSLVFFFNLRQTRSDER